MSLLCHMVSHMLYLIPLLPMSSLKRLAAASAVATQSSCARALYVMDCVYRIVCVGLCV